MNKLKYFLAIIGCMIFMTGVSVSADEKVDIVGKSAIVVDEETGDVLYEKDPQLKEFPASITKIMTALVVLDHKQLTDTVEFSAEGLYSIESGSSAAYIQPGEKMTVEQSLYVMMLHSANDVAHGLAYDVGGNLEGFAKLMNEKAESLGCTNTHFVNASGLHDDNHYTTASDMAKIAKAAYQNEELRKIMGTVRYELPATNKKKEARVWVNGNRMIQEGSKYYYEPCLGGKTGYTITAGGTLVTFAKIKGRVLECIVLKSTNSASAYEDSTKLYEYVKTHTDFSKLGEKTTQSTTSVTSESTQDHANEKIIYKKQERTLFQKVFFVVKIFCIILLILCIGVILRIIYVQRENAKRRRRRMQKKKQRQRENKKKRR